MSCSSENYCLSDMYFDQKMLRKLTVLDYVDEKEIVRVVGRDQSVAWYACEAALGKERYVTLNGYKAERSIC